MKTYKVEFEAVEVFSASVMANSEQEAKDIINKSVPIKGLICYTYVDLKHVSSVDVREVPSPLFYPALGQECWDVENEEIIIIKSLPTQNNEIVSVKSLETDQISEINMADLSERIRPLITEPERNNDVYSALRLAVEYLESISKEFNINSEGIKNILKNALNNVPGK